MTPAARVVVELAPRVALALVVWRRYPMVFWTDVEHYWREFRGGGLPYRDFLWEFPPLTVVPMALVGLPLWLFGPTFAALMAALELAALAVLRSGRDAASRITTYWMIAAWPLVLFAYFRFDFLSVAFAVLAFVAWERGRSGALAIAAGFLAKLWPVSLLAVPLVRARWREVAITIAAVLVATIAWAAFSPSGFREFLEFRQGSGIHVESLFGPVALLLGSDPTFVSGAWVVGAGTLDWIDPLSLVVLAAGAGAIVALARHTNPRPSAVAGAIVALVLVCSRLLSPQFLTWLLPFAALDRVEGRGRAAWLFVVATHLTVIPLLGHAELLAGNDVLALVLLIRNVLLVGVAVAFVTDVRSGRRA